MSDERVVDQRRTDLWLWRHGQGERGNRAPLVRALARLALGADVSDDEADLAMDIAIEAPDWLAIRILPDGRFAGVMPLLFGEGRLGVNHPPGHPCAGWDIFAATWDYERAIDAIAALHAWDPTVAGQEEPAGYLKRCGT
jgi:hypothetical protein